MKHIAAAVLLFAPVAASAAIKPGVLDVPNVSQPDAIARIAADCAANGKEVAGQNDSNISCTRPPTGESAVLCKALFFTPQCPDTARDVWHFAVTPTANGVKIQYMQSVYKEPGKERAYAGAGKNGFEPQLREIFPEAQ